MMNSINNVEIFATGTHNGDTYTEADLDEMVGNYSKVGFMPPLKDGHCKDTPGMPALGWIQNVRRIGNKLVADFVDLHEKVYEAIKTRRYGTVSSEIYWDLKNNNGTFKKALKAVALLGAEIPGVADLRPLREVVFNAESGDIKAYEIELKDISLDVLMYDDHGISFVIGKLKGESSTTVQTIVFNKDKWSKDKAEEWLKKHNFHSGKVDENENSLRFRQKNPEEFEKDSFRTIQPGMMKEEKYKYEEGKDMMTAEEIKKLQDDLVAAQTKIKEFEEKGEKQGDDNKTKVLLHQLEDTQKKLDDAVKLYEETNKKAKELEETQKKERIARKVADCKVPAFQPFIKVFYELATAEAEKIVKFSENGKDDKTVTAESVVDLCVNTLNKATEKLFRVETKIEEFKRNDRPAEDNPASEVDKRTIEYMQKHGEKDYMTAMSAVLAADPDLKKAYAQS